MRPIALDISGLHSFREKRTIEFAPLLEGGLFGIFGPTGSGKSTILDAMTLALYGEVKRATRKTAGIINAREDKCSVGFLFEIGVHGERKRYRVERLFARTNDGGVRTSKARLIEHIGEEQIPLADKDGEVNAKVLEILGINAEDFLRAVVLPQGAFADFLSMKGSERGEMLQRLFGLHELGKRLETQLGDRRAAVQNSRATIEGRLTELQEYNDETLALRTKEQAEAEKAQTLARKALEKATTTYDAVKELHGYITEYANLLQVEEEREQQEQELATMRTRIETAERSRAVAPLIKGLEEARKRHAVAQDEYNKAVEVQKEAVARMDAAREALEKVRPIYEQEYDALGEAVVKLEQLATEKERLLTERKRLKELDERLSELAETLNSKKIEQQERAGSVKLLEEQLGNIDEELQGLAVSTKEREEIDRLRSLVQRLEEQEKRYREEKEGVETLLKNLNETEGGLAAAQANEQEQKKELEEQQRRLGELKAKRTENANRLEQLLQRHGQLTRVKDTTVVHSERLEKLTEELQRHNEHIAQGTEAVEKTEQELQVATANERAKRQTLKELTATLENERAQQALANLASGLTEGEPCPLCGATDHPHPYHTSASEGSKLARLEGEHESAEQELEEAATRARNAGEKYTAAVTTLEHATKARVEVEAKANETRNALAATFTELGGESEVKTPEALTAEIAEVEANGKETRSRITEGEEEIGTVEKNIETTSKHANAAGELRAGLAQKLEANTKQEKEVAGRLALMEAELKELRGELADMAGGKQPDEIRTQLEGLRERERKAETLQNERQKLATKLEEEKEALKEIEKGLREIETQVKVSENERKNVGESVQAKIEEISNQLQALVPENERGEPIEALLQRRKEKREQLKNDYEKAEKQYNEAQNARDVATAKYDSHYITLSREERDRDERDRECAAALKEQGFASAEEATSGMMGETELRILKTNVADTEAALKRRAELLKELEGKIAGRTLAEGEPERSREEHELARSLETDAIEALAVAKSRLNDCREKNAEWHRITNENREAKELAAVLYQLAKYLRGNAFVNFLADEKLADVCYRASLQLRTLTGGRLELGTRVDDGFYIIDNGNGGVERSPGSLSGGETFLVSLALAIALSDTIQLGHAPLEFFFLDEGFGTLDSDLLETVMTSLERLRSPNRTIGVITHVGALRERITRRLVVTPATEAHGSVVEYETA